MSSHRATVEEVADNYHVPTGLTLGPNGPLLEYIGDQQINPDHDALTVHKSVLAAPNAGPAPSTENNSAAVPEFGFRSRPLGPALVPTEPGEHQFSLAVDVDMLDVAQDAPALTARFPEVCPPKDSAASFNTSNHPMFSVQCTYPAVEVHPMPIKFSNDHCDHSSDGADFLTTYLLNSCYELDEVYDPGNVPVSADSHLLFGYPRETARLVSLYQFIKLGHLAKIARIHSIQMEGSTKAFQRCLLEHVCERYCLGKEMVLAFCPLQRARSHVREPLVLDDLQDPDPVPPAVRGLDQVDVLPVTFSNEVNVDPDNGQKYVSTYLLNQEFDFVGVVNRETLEVFISLMSALIKAMNVKQLKDLSGAHFPGVMKKKADLLLNLLQHECSPNCKGWQTALLFKRLIKLRTGPFPRRSTQLVLSEERSRKDRWAGVTATRLAQADEADELGEDMPTLTRRQATEAAVNFARASFPYMTRQEKIREIAETWQDDMEPEKWIPRPCATLPTTYNFAAYSRAILCPAALRRTYELSGMDICHSCKLLLSNHKHPPDSLANFQYYARDELPVEVREAFRQALMFDVMMVARSRATRIAHMFSSRPGASRSMSNPATSQRYSTGNVAIFTQDVASVRSVLPPPQSEVAEAMCALFIGRETLPTRENIRKLSPVLVSKTRVERIITFLLAEKAFYSSSATSFSRENLDTMFGSDWAGSDSGVPTGVELQCLPDPSTGPTDSYADQGDQAAHQNLSTDPESIVMEAVGYTAGEEDICANAKQLAFGVGQ
ncbi:hypothetical protein B0H17DRAFT_1136419 [Mycena rosella]|uniref:DUF6570 domain-containing protein n=1 Tax=Mycena rosella TaxID=1033263 RepID=A0AAD7DE68_MYCRO|nr:hypothetical protein B0H17DRAFT_1136419 [Mycena rosella]